MAATIGANGIIVVADVVESVALKAFTMCPVEKAGRTFRLTGHRVNLGDVIDGVAMYNIDASIVINQKARVIKYMMVCAIVIDLLF